MSIECLSVALNQQIAGDPGAKMVLMGLANHADKFGRDAYPSQKTLAEYAGISVATVKRKIAYLESVQLIFRGDQQKVAHLRGDRRPVVWDIAMTAVAQIEPPQDERGLKSTSDGSSLVSYKPSLDSLQESKPSSAEFDQFWTEYPLKRDKGHARTAWNVAVKKVSAETIIEGAKRYAVDPRRTVKFTKYPQGWLSGECWADEMVSANDDLPSYWRR